MKTECHSSALILYNLTSNEEKTLKYNYLIFQKNMPTYHMWIFGYFRNQLCPCDVVSRDKKTKTVMKSNSGSKTVGQKSI